MNKLEELEALVKNYQYEDALNNANEYLNEHPDDLEIQDIKVYLVDELEGTTKSLDLAKELLQKDKNLKYSNGIVGRDHFFRDELSEAESYLQLAVEGKHIFAEDLYGLLAEVYKNKKEYQQAADYYFKAYEKTGNSDMFINGVLIIRDYLNDDQKAKELLEEKINEYQDCEITDFRLFEAQTYIKYVWNYGDEDRTLSLFDELEEKNSANIAFYIFKVKLLETNVGKYFDLILKTYDQIIELLKAKNENYSIYYLSKGDMYFDFKKYDKAEEGYLNALNSPNGNKWQTYYSLIKTTEQAGHIDKSLEYFNLMSSKLENKETVLRMLDLQKAFLIRNKLENKIPDLEKKITSLSQS